MLFNSVSYWLFFGAVLLVFYQLRFVHGKIFLVAASYIFYAMWSAKFLLLIVGSTAADYALGLLLGNSTGPSRKALLGASLVVNLGCLAFFKYYDFFVSSAASFLGQPANSWTLHLALPVGISFYTFASLSYTIDVYKGRMRPVRSFIDYALYVSFFPHLPAGPIVRAGQFLSQMGTWQKPSAAVVQNGIILILSGLIKKMIFADRFAVIGDTYFANPGACPGWLPAASGAFAFWLQLYFDFSGYTDIARGCAKLLGFELPLNFIRPYLAASAVELWQRWHISLGRWVHDYVFQPLNGRRPSRLLLARNVLIAMVVIGLWHGASWQFLLWGVYFGILLNAYRVYRYWSAGTLLRTVTDRRGFHPIAVGLMVFSSVVPLVLFRSPTLHEAGVVLHSIFDFTGPRGEALLTPLACLLFFAAFTIAVLEERSGAIERLIHSRPLFQVIGYVIVFLALELLSVTDASSPFIYFQF